MNSFPKEFVTPPIVYAVKNTYQIMVPVSCETVMWVRVGDQCFYDDSNGILRSACSTHRMVVPAELLDREKMYTICYRVIHERKPYFTETGDVLYYKSKFRPIEKEPVRIYHIADAHNQVEKPVSVGKYFGDNLDLLILNGDIPNHSGDISYFTTIHEIAAQLTNGEIPVVFSRGNHDMRGIYGEKIEDHVPTDHGNSFYTFRVGHIWGIVLDCGEDKADEHEAYGNTICCKAFRRRQTEYLNSVVAECRKEYEAEGVTNRLVICHVPFTEKFPKPFDIDEEIYAEWAALLRENVRPQLMLCGHMHKAYITHVGDANDCLGQPCPVVVGSQMSKNIDDPFVGCAITLFHKRCNVVFNANDGKILNQEEILFK